MPQPAPQTRALLGAPLDRVLCTLPTPITNTPRVTMSLHKAGKLEFNMYEGTHTSYNETWWKSTVMPVFNTTMKLSNE